MTLASAAPVGTADFGGQLSRHFGVDDVEPIGGAQNPASGVAIARVAYPLPHLFTLNALDPDDAFMVNVDLAPAGARRFVNASSSLATGLASQGAVHILDLRDITSGYVCSPFDAMVFRFPRACLDACAQDLGVRNADQLLSPQGAVDPVIGNISMAMSLAGRQPGPCPLLLIDHLALALGLHLIRHYSGSAVPATRTHCTLSAWQLRRAKDFLLQNLDGRVTLSEVAAECRLSRSYFIHAFKSATGHTPYSWLIDQRLDHAEHLLLDAGRSIVNVALACGFADQSHLTRVFSQRRGQAPAAWRKARLH